MAETKKIPIDRFAVRDAISTRRRLGATGNQVVEMARQYTERAIKKLVDLMDGKAGKLTVLDKEGNVVEVDIEVPANVQVKCAELLLERGYGKSPQAVLLKSDSPLALSDGERRELSVQDRIRLLLEARAAGPVVDLEASQQGETTVEDDTPLEIVVVEGRPPEKPAEPPYEYPFPESREEDDPVLDLI